MHRVNACGEEVGVGVELGGVEGGLEEGLDGFCEGVARHEVEFWGNWVGDAAAFLGVELVDLVLVHADCALALDGSFAGAEEGLVGGGEHDHLAADLAVGDGFFVGFDYDGPDVFDEVVALFFGLGGFEGLDHEGGHELVCSNDDGALDPGMAHDELFDADGVEFLAVGEYDDVIGSAAKDPVVGEGGMGLVEVFGAVLLQVGERVKEALESRFFALAHNDLFKDAFFVCLAPFAVPVFRVEDEPLPEVFVFLPVGWEGGKSG